MKKHLRIASIGVSHWHSVFDSAYLKRIVALENVTLVAIQDENTLILEDRRERLGTNVLTFTDYETMVDEVEPDLVIALGAHDRMGEVAHYLLDKNMPFLMEKPMSFSALELKSVVEKSRVTNGFASVALHNRFTQFVSLAKQYTSEQTYGPLTHFYSRMNRPTSLRYPNWGSDWMLDPSRSNGGCLRNLGNHGLDIFCYLTGTPDSVSVTGAQLSWKTLEQGVEDYASVMISTPTGVLGTVEIGNCYPSDGTDGEWKAGFQNALLVHKGESLKLITREGDTIIPEVKEDAVDTLLKNVLDSVRAGAPPQVSVEDCYNAVRLIDSAYLFAGNPYGTAAV